MTTLILIIVLAAWVAIFLPIAILTLVPRDAMADAAMQPTRPGLRGPVTRVGSARERHARQAPAPGTVGAPGHHQAA